MELKPVASTQASIFLALACDPSVAQANPAEKLAHFRWTDSYSLVELQVPRDATVYQLRALSKAELHKATRRAGRQWATGAAAHSKLILAGQTALEAEAAAAKAEGRPPRPGAFREGINAAQDALDDDTYTRLLGFKDWQMRHAIEVCALALQDVYLGADPDEAVAWLRLDYDGPELDGQARAARAGRVGEIDVLSLMAAVDQYQGRALSAIQDELADLEAEVNAAQEAVRARRAAEGADEDAGDVDPEEEAAAADLMARLVDLHARSAHLQALTGEEVVREIAHHVLQVSRPGKGPWTYSPWPLGEGATPTPAAPPGAAGSA